MRTTSKKKDYGRYTGDFLKERDKLSVVDYMWEILSRLVLSVKPIRVGQNAESGGSIVGLVVRVATGLLGAILCISSFGLFLIPIFSLAMSWADAIIAFAAIQIMARVIMDTPDALDKAIAWVKVIIMLGKRRDVMHALKEIHIKANRDVRKELSEVVVDDIDEDNQEEED